MQEKGHFIERDGALWPANERAEELVAEVRRAKGECLVHIHTPRNLKHHNLFFALLKVIMDAGGWDGTQRGLLRYLKVATGHAEPFIDHTGKVSWAPDSIAFEAMSQRDFSTFFDAAINVACRDLLSGSEFDQVKAEVLHSTDQGYEAMRHQ